jgi:hypothetical protein
LLSGFVAGVCRFPIEAQSEGVCLCAIKCVGVRAEARGIRIQLCRAENGGFSARFLACKKENEA